MKLKLSQIVEAQPALARLGSEKLPIKMAYTIGRNIQKLRPELENYEKTRTDLIRNKYGTKTEDGGHEVPARALEKFGEEIKELLGVEIELDIWTVKLSELEALEKGKSEKDKGKEIVTPLELFVLDWMFEYDLKVNGHNPAPKKRRTRK